MESPVFDDWFWEEIDETTPTLEEGDVVCVIRKKPTDRLIVGLIKSITRDYKNGEYYNLYDVYMFDTINPYGNYEVTTKYFLEDEIERF